MIGLTLADNGDYDQGAKRFCSPAIWASLASVQRLYANIFKYLARHSRKLPVAKAQACHDREPAKRWLKIDAKFSSLGPGSCKSKALTDRLLLMRSRASVEGSLDTRTALMNKGKV